MNTIPQDKVKKVVQEINCIHRSHRRKIISKDMWAANEKLLDA